MSEYDAKRLELLEAVAEAARADARIHLDFMRGKGMAFAGFLAKYGEHMSDNGRAILEALAALEEYDA